MYECRWRSSCAASTRAPILTTTAGGWPRSVADLDASRIEAQFAAVAQQGLGIDAASQALYGGLSSTSAAAASSSSSSAIPAQAAGDEEDDGDDGGGGMAPLQASSSSSSSSLRAGLTATGRPSGKRGRPSNAELAARKKAVEAAALNLQLRQQQQQQRQQQQQQALAAAAAGGGGQRPVASPAAPASLSSASSSAGVGTGAQQHQPVMSAAKAAAAAALERAAALAPVPPNPNPNPRRGAPKLRFNPAMWEWQLDALAEFDHEDGAATAAAGANAVTAPLSDVSVYMNVIRCSDYFGPEGVSEDGRSILAAAAAAKAVAEAEAKRKAQQEAEAAERARQAKLVKQQQAKAAAAAAGQAAATAAAAAASAAAATATSSTSITTTNAVVAPQPFPGSAMPLLGPSLQPFSASLAGIPAPSSSSLPSGTDGSSNSNNISSGSTILPLTFPHQMISLGQTTALPSGAVLAPLLPPAGVGGGSVSASPSSALTNAE